MIFLRSVWCLWHRVCKFIEKIQSLSNLAASLRCCAPVHFMSLQTKSTAQMAHYASPNEVCMLLLFCCHLHARNFGVTHGQQMRMIESSMEVYIPYGFIWNAWICWEFYAVISHEVDATTAFPLESGEISVFWMRAASRAFMKFSGPWRIIVRSLLSSRVHADFDEIYSSWAVQMWTTFFEFGYNYVVSFYSVSRHTTLMFLDKFSNASKIFTCLHLVL